MTPGRVCAEIAQSAQAVGIRRDPVDACRYYMGVVVNQLTRLGRPGWIINISSIGARLASPSDLPTPSPKQV